MSNPLNVHEPDTPISTTTGTESPVHNTRVESPISVSKLITTNKDEVASSESSSPKANGSSSSSGGSSPSVLTPPANGILTPPTDMDNGCDTEKQGKHSGRLKFYKDGILCLELSHHNEGEKTKWVQIRTKTVFPTVIHTTKEATIPCHVSPTSFASPSSTSALQSHSRVESSTSHSMSDDGSSMLSSPRLRENTWKQSVPQKGISSCLEFFCKPAVCVFNIRQKLYTSSKSQVLKLNRKPYNCQILTVLQKSNVKLLCSCFNGDNSLNYKESFSKNEDIVDGNLKSDNACSDTPRLQLNGVEILKNMRTHNKITKRKCNKISVQVIVDRLKHEREHKLKKDLNLKLSPFGDTKTQHGKNQAGLPKKRAFREMDSKDLFTSVRPKKKSPNRNHDTKTILNVPGLNSEFYRRSHSSIPLEIGGLFCQKPTHSLQGVGDSKSNVLVNSKSANKAGKNGIPSGKRNDSSSNSYHIGAKSLSPSKLSLKSTTSSSELVHDSKVFNNQISYPINSAMCISSLPPKQQEQFQRQTMTKAISYTINSLLSNPGTNEIGSSKNSILKSNVVDHSTHSSSKSVKTEKVKHGESNSNAVQQEHQELPQGLFGIRGDQDQNSFLRHLLDTSDPIPAVKPEKNSVKQSRSSPTSRNSSKTISNDSQQCDLRKSNTSHKPAPNSSKTPSSSSPLNLNNHHQLGQYPQFMHPSIVNSGFPMSLTAYDSLLRGQDPSSSALAAAAAAAFQYQSLIPANILSNLNTTMAAAMAASYLGGTPNNTSGTSSSPLSVSRSPPVHQSSSPINYSSSSPLNLSQRAWPGLVNGLIPGSVTIPVPFHAPLGDNLHSASRHVHSRGRMNKGNDIPDNADVPLNLSKKPKPS